MDQRAKETACKEVEPEVVGGSEVASAPPLLAHPCSLLHLLLRACAGCLGLHGYWSDNDPKPAAADDDDDLKPVADDDEDAAPAVAETLQQGADGGEAATYLYLQEVYTRVRKPTPPGPPRPGSGGGGGKHN